MICATRVAFGLSMADHILLQDLGPLRCRQDAGDRVVRVDLQQHLLGVEQGLSHPTGESGESSKHRGPIEGALADPKAYVDFTAKSEHIIGLLLEMQGELKESILEVAHEVRQASTISRSPLEVKRVANQVPDPWEHYPLVFPSSTVGPAHPTVQDESAFPDAVLQGANQSKFGDVKASSPKEVDRFRLVLDLQYVGVPDKIAHHFITMW